MSSATSNPGIFESQPTAPAVSVNGPSGGAAAPQATPPAASSAEIGPRSLNRELQWLAFNDRVPLLERVRFMAIHANNLDEFFMKRVGGLRRQLAAGVGASGPELMSPAQQLTAIRERLLSITQQKADCYRNQILPALKAESIELLA